MRGLSRGDASRRPSIIEPAIHAVAPSMRVVVTSGFQVPDGRLGDHAEQRRSLSVRRSA